MDKGKKILTIFTIASTCVVSLLLILLLFGVKIFGDFNASVIITFACFGIGGFFAINSLNMFDKNKTISLVSLGLICLSVLLIILSTWIKFDSDLYSDITISLGFLSVLFNVIVSSSLDLGKKWFPVQIGVFAVVGLFDIITTLALFDVVKLGDFILIYVALIIVMIVGVIILKVLSKKNLSDVIADSKNKVVISKEEYEMLLEKSKKYDQVILSQNKSNELKGD
jgi:hypothetical protein